MNDFSQNDGTNKAANGGRGDASESAPQVDAETKPAWRERKLDPKRAEEKAQLENHLPEDLEKLGPNSPDDDVEEFLRLLRFAPEYGVEVEPWLQKVAPRTARDVNALRAKFNEHLREYNKDKEPKPDKNILTQMDEETAEENAIIAPFAKWRMGDEQLQATIKALPDLSAEDKRVERKRLLQAIALRPHEHADNAERLEAISKHTGVGKAPLTSEVTKLRAHYDGALRRLTALRAERDGETVIDAENMCPELYERLRGYNQRFAVVRIKADHRVVELPAKGSDPLEFMKERTFLTTYGTDQVDTGRKELTKVADTWMRRWTKRLTFNKGVKFDPNKNATISDGKLNLWRGFSVEGKAGDWSRLRRHLFENVCRGNPFWFAWVMCWLANIIQDPTNKPGTAIVAIGLPGVGKTKVAEHVVALMEHNAMIMSKQEQVFGRFNSHLANLLFAGMEEVFWAGDKKAEGVFKDLITGHEHLIEPKGVDAFKVANYLRVWLCSNEDWVAPVAAEDRRFFVLRVGEAHKQDKPYFAAIDRQMEMDRDRDGRLGGRGLAAMMHDLEHLPRPTWIDLRQPPRTPWRADQVEETFETIDAWWHEVMRDGEITDNGVTCEWPESGQHVDPNDAGANHRGYPVKDLPAGHMRVPVDRVWASLQQFAKTNPKRKGRVSNVKLGKFLAQRGVDNSKPGNKVRVRCYDFPPLAELRAQFTSATGIAIAGEGEGSVSDFSTLVPADIKAEALAAWAAYGAGKGPLPHR